MSVAVGTPAMAASAPCVGMPPEGEGLTGPAAAETPAAVAEPPLVPASPPPAWVLPPPLAPTPVGEDWLVGGAAAAPAP